MTFQQYIDNPMGKKNAVFSGREMYRAQYEQKFGEVNLREAGKLDYQLFFNEQKDEWYCYMKIPSESVPDFYYDVVVRFRTEDNGLRTAGGLSGYDVEFFSNDPAFVYTYLRVFELNKMFIDDFKTRAPKLALKQDPIVRNTYMVPGYVKSIYFAYLYMKGRNLFTKANYKQFGTRYNKNNLINQIPTFEDKMKIREIKEEEYKKAKAKHKKIVTSTAKSHEKDPLDPNRIKPYTTEKVKTVKRVPIASHKTGTVVSKAKKVKTVKSVKHR